MAVYNVATDLIQKIGNDLYHLNLSTLAKQVEMFAEDGSTRSNAQKEIESLRKKLNDLNSTVSGNATIYVKATISERDDLTDVPKGSICYVINATGDSTVTAGAASYLWDGTAWNKLTEFESLDLVLDWINIRNKPGEGSSVPEGWPTNTSGQPLKTEDAIKMAHTHENKDTVLDKLALSADGKLQFNSKTVGTDNGGTFHTTVTGENPDYNTAITALGDIPDGSTVYVFRETPTVASVSRSKSFSLR